MSQLNYTGITLELHEAWAYANSYGIEARLLAKDPSWTRSTRSNLRRARMAAENAIQMIEQDLRTLEQMEDEALER